MNFDVVLLLGSQLEGGATHRLSVDGTTFLWTLLGWQVPVKVFSFDCFLWAKPFEKID